MTEFLGNDKMEKMTHRQLAEWCARSFGEWMHKPSHSNTTYSEYKYYDYLADRELGENNEGQSIVIRRWSEQNWKPPMLVIYNADCVEATE